VILVVHSGMHKAISKLSFFNTVFLP